MRFSLFSTFCLHPFFFFHLSKEEGLKAGNTKTRVSFSLLFWYFLLSKIKFCKLKPKIIIINLFSLNYNESFWLCFVCQANTTAAKECMLFLGRPLSRWKIILINRRNYWQRKTILVVLTSHKAIFSLWPFRSGNSEKQSKPVCFQLSPSFLSNLLSTHKLTHSIANKNRTQYLSLIAVSLCRQ